jgi:hypothetical protein
MGRPKKPADEKVRALQICLAPHILASLDRQARLAGMNRSAYIALLVSKGNPNEKRD